MFGIFNINKPQGFTSHDVVAKLRKILGIKQIGHTGTLDPMAVGVLPICIGKATRIIDYLDTDKSYRATVKLGIITDTYDMEGKILEEKPVILDLEQVKTHLSKFLGEIEQVPPIYSAIHYKGKRLYEYARSNVVIDDIPKRKVKISDIKLVEVLNVDSEHPELVIDVDCSGGTYIRSIAYDLGEMLGCGAALSALVRTKAAGFVLNQSFTIEDIEKLKANGEIEKFITNPVCMLNLKCCKIDENLLEKLRHGQHVALPDNGTDYIENERIALVFDDNLAAIAEFKDTRAFPKIVFI